MLYVFVYIVVVYSFNKRVIQYVPPKNKSYCIVFFRSVFRLTYMACYADRDRFLYKAIFRDQ